MTCHLQIRRGGETVSSCCEAGTLLHEALRQAGIYVPSPCGGRGQCGKCTVSLTIGGETKNVPACRTPVTGDCTVEVPEDDIALRLLHTGQPGADTAVTAAVDLGTTTVVCRLLRQSDGLPLAECREWNAQQFAGADVISRCQWISSHEDGLAVLHRAVTEQLQRMLQRMLAACGLPDGALKGVITAGNTIMQHILFGLDPTPMAVSPFVPQTLFRGALPRCADDRLTAFPGVPVTAAPCAGPYIGGDIMAGLTVLTQGPLPMYTLLLDLGTNGEMALRVPQGWLCCSAATGPAFEGAQISCGMQARPGAIAHIRLSGDHGRWETEVIGGAVPQGLCGSAMVDLLSALIREEAVTVSGRLLGTADCPDVPGLDDDGSAVQVAPGVSFTAGDIRQLQLAKAAVAAGIDRLLSQAGITDEMVAQVCIAGGFGSALDPDALCAIGMLPQGWQTRVRAVGNTSLQGAALLQTHMEDAARLADSCRIITLSGDPDFEDAFIDHMYFGEEE